jgi:hypothetical protein
MGIRCDATCVDLQDILRGCISGSPSNYQLLLDKGIMQSPGGHRATFSVDSTSTVTSMVLHFTLFSIWYTLY